MGVKNIIGELTVNGKKVVTEDQAWWTFNAHSWKVGVDVGALSETALWQHVYHGTLKLHYHPENDETTDRTEDIVEYTLCKADREQGNLWFCNFDAHENTYSYILVNVPEGGSTATISQLDSMNIVSFQDFQDVKTALQSKESVIDVIALPTVNIDATATYRLLKGIFMRGGLMRNDYNCYIVEWDSPSGTGEPVIKYINGEMIVSGYYNNKNNTVYGYVDSVTKTALTEKIDQMVADGSLNSIVAAGLKLAISTMSTGWKTMDEIFSNAVVSQLASWGGIITTPEQATNEDAAYVLLYDEFYSYKHNTWIGVDLHIGMQGDGPGAEKFNDLNNIASGARSHAEGHLTVATGGNTHAEGYATLAEGNASHAEGAGSKAYALAAHAEGRDSYANSEASHAEGEFTSATGVGSHTEGYRTRTNGKGAHHEGIRLDGSETVTRNDIEYTYGANTDASHAEGINTVAGGESEHKAAHAEGADTIAAGWSAHAEGLGSYAVGNAAHAEGRGTSANGEGSHAEGRDTVAQGIGSHVEGVRLSQYEPATRDGKEYNFGAFAQGAHAEGLNTGAHGEASHTEGSDTIATAKGAHAEGLATYVTGQGAHGEGRNSWATGNYAHAEGYGTKAQGAQSHAAGNGTIAAGASSYAGGTDGSTASVTGSFVHGKGVKDNRWYQAVFGLFNKADVDENGKIKETSDYLVVGSGSSDTNRENCFAAGKNGTDGKYITIGDTKLTEAKLNKLADKDYIDDAIGDIDGRVINVGEVLFYDYSNIDEYEAVVTDTITFKPAFQNAYDHIDKPMTLINRGYLPGGVYDEQIFYSYHSTWYGDSFSFEICFHAFLDDGIQKIIKLVYQYETEYSETPVSITAYLTTERDANRESPVIAGTGANSIQMVEATATGKNSAAFGTSIASNEAAHAEGVGTTASGVGAHAEGGPMIWDGTHNTIASGKYAHAEGEGTTASGECSHSEGLATLAQNKTAHAEGWDSQALADATHAEGWGTLAKVRAQHVEGKFNADEATALHITGCGTSGSARANCFTAGIDGSNKYISVGSTRLTEAELINIKNGTVIPLPITRGGTGATDPADARTKLGITPANIGAATSDHTHELADVGLKTKRVIMKIPANGVSVYHDLGETVTWCNVTLTGAALNEEDVGTAYTTNIMELLCNARLYVLPNYKIQGTDMIKGSTVWVAQATSHTESDVYYQVDIMYK